MSWANIPSITGHRCQITSRIGTAGTKPAVGKTLSNPSKVRLRETRLFIFCQGTGEADCPGDPRRGSKIGKTLSNPSKARPFQTPLSKPSRRIRADDPSDRPNRQWRDGKTLSNSDQGRRTFSCIREKGR